MSRSADYTIKGFLYQFNKTLLEILNSQDDGVITVEGIVEDVDIKTLEGMTAIQCKYHETSDTFTPSIIFKPLLQMLLHYQTNSAYNINYVLFAHIGGVEKKNLPKVGKAELEAATKSKSKKYTKLIDQLNDVDIDQFLSRFSMEFGPAFDALVDEVSNALEKNGVVAGEIETLAYPNAINIIANLSIKHDEAERKISKLQLLDSLKDIRKTAISHWTLSLRTRKQLLDARRKQLKANLDKNSRLRYLIVDAKNLDDFDEEIVLFVTDYLEKYHSKPAHVSTPVLCLRSSAKSFQEIQHRLYSKGITSTDGYIGGQFEDSYFYRDPLSQGSGSSRKREFSLRLLLWEDHEEVLNSRKCDDLFIIGTGNYDALETRDVNIEYLAATSLKEIKYIIGVSNVYE